LKQALMLQKATFSSEEKHNSLKITVLFKNGKIAGF